MSADVIQAETIDLRVQDGDLIPAYLARPAGDARRGGVVVIHHMPGYDASTKEIARTFAVHGYTALCPNLHHREAPGAAPAEASQAVRDAGGVPDARCVADVGAAASYLRDLPTSNGKVGVIGYCSGGRQSVLAACSLDLDAAVDCYGAFVTGTPPAEYPLKITNLVELLPDLRAPLLGLFGADDKFPGPEQVAELEAILKANDKTFELHSYEGAGHAFFSTERPAYNVAAATDGWARITAFYAQHLGA